MQKTYMQKTAEVKRQWHLVDVKGKVLGRVATEIAKKLIGKDKVSYTPHIDGGDYVVVINAKEVEVTRSKNEKKIYSWHSGWPGGLKQRNFSQMQDAHPERIIMLAVKNMMPKNRQNAERLKRLKVFIDGEHIYADKFKQ